MPAGRPDRLCGGGIAHRAFQNIRHADTRLAEQRTRVRRINTDNVLRFLPPPRSGIGGRQVNLVKHRHHFQDPFHRGSSSPTFALLRPAVSTTSSAPRRRY